MEGNLTALFSEIHRRNIVVRGAMEWFLPAYRANAFWGDKTPPLLSLCEKQRMIFDWIADGRLKVEPLLSHRLAPGKIQEAYEGLLNSPKEFTGVVLDWSGDV
jgi:hypothetical protein